MKPHIHAEASAKQFGGKPEDYLAIHEFIDCSKGVVADHRHRALTHNTWFIMNILPRVFGDTIKNSKGKKVSVRDIGEQHVLEDYRGKFIPSAQDFLQAMAYEAWMNNGEAYPPSNPKGATKPADELAEMRKIIEDLRNRPVPFVPVEPHYPYPWPPKNPYQPGLPEITDSVKPWPSSGTYD